jgi:hypothetical protein
MKRLVVLFLLLLGLSGCQNHSEWYSRPMFAKMRFALPEESSTIVASLPRDFICDLPGGTRLGGNRITVLAGDYTIHGADNEGVFWRHASRGIIRSGNLGQAEAGGVYVPHDVTQRCVLWIVPRNQPVYLGAAVIIPQKVDPYQFAIYIGDLAEPVSTELRSHFPSTSGDSGPTSTVAASSTR